MDNFNNRFNLHYLNEKNITFLCISDKSYSKYLAYGFLEELSGKFFKTFNQKQISDAGILGLNNLFYEKLMPIIVFIIILEKKKYEVLKSENSILINPISSRKNTKKFIIKQMKT